MTSEELQKLEKLIAEQIAQRNSAPNPEIDNLSPLDMSAILYDTFSEESPIGIKKKIPIEVYERIPFMKGLRMLFEAIGEKGIKLTPKGNLPRKLSHDLFYEIGVNSSLYDATYKKQPNQDDLVEVTNLKIVSELAGLVKKRAGKLSMTAKSRKICSPENANLLFEKIFTTNYQKFNLGYHDGYPDNTSLQNCFGYTLYLLLQYGQKMCSNKFYIEKNLMAFPMFLSEFEEHSSYSTPQESYERAYWIRIFARFLKYYGFIEYTETKIPGQYRGKIDVRASDLFYEIFELRKDKFVFKYAKFKA